MVEDELCRDDSSLNKMVTIDENKVNSDIHCIHCDKLKLELQMAKLEISSYEEILKSMQEEICADPSTHTRLQLQRGEKNWITGIVTSIIHLSAVNGLRFLQKTI